MDMPFGTRVQGTFMLRCRLATWVAPGKADSNVSSIFCYPQMIRPTRTMGFQSTTNRSSRAYQIISTLAYFVQMTFVQPESLWSPAMDHRCLLLGSWVAQSKCSFT